MIIECPRCKSRYDSTLKKPGDQISCRCGQAFYTPKLPNLAKSSNCPNCGGAASPDQNKCTYCGVYLAFARCPGCFSVAPYQGAKFCAECGDSLIQAAKLSSEANEKFPCPRCKSVDLKRKTIGKFTVDSCIQCSGVWLDHEILTKLITQGNQSKSSQALLGQRPLTAANLKRHKVTYLPCPECKQVMFRKNFAKKSGIIIDECSAHGIWFDKHELAAIIHFVKSSPEAIEHKAVERPSEAEMLSYKVKIKKDDTIRISDYDLIDLFTDFPSFFD